MSVSPCGCTCSPRPVLLDCVWPSPASGTLTNCKFGVGGVLSSAFPLFAPTRWRIVGISGVILAPVGGASTDVWESDSYTSGSRTWFWRLQIAGATAASITLKKIYTAHPDGDFPGEILFTALRNLGAEASGQQIVCLDRSDASLIKWFTIDFPCCYTLVPYDAVETLPVPGTLYNTAAIKWSSSLSPGVYNYYSCRAELGGGVAPFADYTYCYFASFGTLAMGFKLAINCDTGLIDLYEKPNGTGSGFAGTRLAVAGLSPAMPTPISWTTLPNVFGNTREYTIESFSTT